MPTALASRGRLRPCARQFAQHLRLGGVRDRVAGVLVDLDQVGQGIQVLPRHLVQVFDCLCSSIQDEFIL
jgi:hypothetical protein